MITGIQNGEDSAMEQMKVFSSQMNKFMAAGDEGLYDVSAAEEKIASIATSIEELDQLTEQYSLSEATYAKAITGLFASAANEAKSLTELDELKKKVLDAGGEVNNDVYLENVKRLSEEAMNAAGSMSALA
jgi:division protein CdvB (Snf7/Vps24/ESCRT-III family)